jgi:AraC-like DNA-binding protein
VVADKLKLLCIDLTVGGREADLPQGFLDHCEVRFSGKTQPIEPQLRRGRPDVVCFDFDYPDRASLQLAAAVKQAWPSLPMIMLTVQHSESLAVWAFRSRFTDYLVKPVPPADVERCLALLYEIGNDKRMQNRRRMPSPPVPMPEEAPMPVASENSLLPAISFVESNYHTKIQSEEVARLCAMSPFRFSRAFRETFGMPFREYVVRARLKEACRLLENPQASITEVAFAVGFNDISYFSRMFKRYVGVSPSALHTQRPVIAPEPPPVLEVPPVLELPLPLN